jgi:hypothetical protein
VAFARADELGAFLSHDERARAARFAAPALARRFQASRHALRTVLGRRTGTDPRDVVFEVGVRGKPAVRGARFSTARSADAYVVAVTDDKAIGIDVEQLRADVDVRLTARVAITGPLSRRDRNRSFLSRWVRTEAIVKARGDDLLSWWAGGRGDIDASGLTCLSFEREPDLIGCVAVSGKQPIRLTVRPGLEALVPSWELEDDVPRARTSGDEGRRGDDVQAALHRDGARDLRRRALDANRVADTQSDPPCRAEPCEPGPP